MDTALLNRIDKILALTDSGYEEEALAAVRKARQLLAEAGMSFADLAGIAARRKVFLPFRQQPDPAAAELLQQLTMQRKQAEQQSADYRLRIAALEAQLEHSRQESRRWHKLARESVDTLWQWATPKEAASYPAATFMPDSSTPRKSA